MEDRPSRNSHLNRKGDYRAEFPYQITVVSRDHTEANIACQRFEMWLESGKGQSGRSVAGLGNKLGLYGPEDHSKKFKIVPKDVTDWMLDLVYDYLRSQGYKRETEAYDAEGEILYKK
jgi:hypothetical protein